MKRIFIPLLLFLILGACTRTETPEVAPTVQARQATLATVADRLIARYNSAVTSCAGGTPAFNCSGVLIRRVNYDPNSDFWGYSADEARVGSATFSYIRNGLNSSSDDITSGYVLMDPDSAKAAGKLVLKARCIFPFMADAQSNSRAMHGCGFANRPDPTPLPDDLSNCATLAVPAVTPPAWIKNFNEHGPSRINQCSLSTMVAAQFATSLTVRASYPDLTKLYGNELLFEPWETQAPANLPIEAIFYNASKEGSLVNAQALKHAYRTKTDIELPIIRLDFGTGAKRFVLREVDQEDGWTVAKRLNERYANTTGECPGAKAAVYCSGVLARAISYSTSYKAWNPNPGSAQPEGVSFSFLRADVKTLAMFRDKPAGIIFRELEYAHNAGMTPVQALCIFIDDGATDRRLDKGCGAHAKHPTGSASCASQGITTFDQFRQHYLSIANLTTRREHECSLAIEPVPFMLSIEARRQLVTGSESVYHRFNELMIEAWPMDIPSRLPLDTFYYVAGESSGDGLRQAKEIQKDFWRSTDGQIKPVIRLNLAASAGDWFTYQREEQAY
ncbi:hypothetical protein N5D61_22010 [Pseudomonas sp. GD03842]|uniref:hypothetical protein n=1 Tax=Pseudomonas sp. GD03842 TaxID=2975385 RepID=UPI00244C5E0A|nr:hypothetical protein [Pseudomonas sp. GD03842]MDH0749008.1 hypothetical protein [Pseudomonas sp. GD03842]